MLRYRFSAFAGSEVEREEAVSRSIDMDGSIAMLLMQLLSCWNVVDRRFYLYFKGGMLYSIR